MQERHPAVDSLYIRVHPSVWFCASSRRPLKATRSVGERVRLPASYDPIDFHFTVIGRNVYI